MKKFRLHVPLTLSLIIVSALCYLLQILIFHRDNETFFYMLQDIAFVPIQVLLVTLVINELLRLRENSILQHKLNMIIGAFFSEVGSEILSSFYQFDTRKDEIRKIAGIDTDWSDKDFSAAVKQLEQRAYPMDCKYADLNDLRRLLLEHRSFLIDLIGNQNLLEHESFTDLLWAISHLTEELAYRSDLDYLPESDYIHLAGDMRRAYVLLTISWLSYAKHLKDDYPFMYSLIVRMNPFNPEASPVVKA